jgi:hypothetical protein
MASEEKNSWDDGPARGWDLFNWKRIAEPPELVSAGVYGLLLVIFLLVAASGVIALWQLLAPIWTGVSLVPSLREPTRVRNFVAGFSSSAPC